MTELINAETIMTDLIEQMTDYMREIQAEIDESEAALEEARMKQAVMTRILHAVQLRPKLFEDALEANACH